MREFSTREDGQIDWHETTWEDYSLVVSIERSSRRKSWVHFNECKCWRWKSIPSLFSYWMPSDETKLRVVRGRITFVRICLHKLIPFYRCRVLSLCRMRWWWRCKWRTKERWWLRLIVCLVRVSFIYGWRPESREMLRASPNTLYSCPFNSMCHCLTMPNETTVLEINCNEVSLYKFPGELFRFFCCCLNLAIVVT